MFDGDPNAAGRRAARLKKEQRGPEMEITGKVGQGAQSARRGSQEGQELGSKPGSGLNSQLFSQRISAKRHSFGIEITCQMPLLDMSVSAGRRSITFHCEADSHTVKVPEGFDVEKAAIVSDEFEQGRCGIEIPMVQRSVFG